MPQLQLTTQRMHVVQRQQLQAHELLLIPSSLFSSVSFALAAAGRVLDPVGGGAHLSIFAARTSRASSQSHRRCKRAIVIGNSRTTIAHAILPAVQVTNSGCPPTQSC
jgi:hypothetical protein